MKSESPGSPAWKSVWVAGTFNSSTTLARATRSSSLRSSNILILARYWGSQGIGGSSLRSRRTVQERRHYSPCPLKSELMLEINAGEARTLEHYSHECSGSSTASELYGDFRVGL